MAPKKDVGGKKAPSKSKGGAADAESKAGEEPPPPAITVLAASTTFKNFVIFVTLVLVGIAIATAVIYFLEAQNTENIIKATEEIRKTLIEKGEAHGAMSDPEILAEATRIAEKLHEWNIKNDEMARAVGGINRRRDEGWIPFRGHLYYFSPDGGKWEAAKEDCKKNRSMLAYDIETDDEAKFLEEKVRFKGNPHWIGLRRIASDWAWETISPLHKNEKNKYWKEGSPTPAESWERDDDKRLDTAFITVCSSTNLKCWKNDVRTKMFNWICKMAPEERYLPTSS